MTTGRKLNVSEKVETSLLHINLIHIIPSIVEASVWIDQKKWVDMIKRSNDWEQAFQPPRSNHFAEANYKLWV